MKRIALCITLLFLIAVSAAGAQTLAPAQMAETIRQSLFNAQIALMSGETETAAAAITDAVAAYEVNLQVVIELSAPAADARIQVALAQAQDAVITGDAAKLAAARSTLWTALLDGAAYTVYGAINDGDSATAAQWLPLRDFRASTRFSRPGADATLAVAALAQGDLTEAQALAAVRADLLDTYQAQLNAVLANADEAAANQFSLRLAEEAARAQGYFAILALPFGEQYGAEAQAEAEAQFAALVNAALANDMATYEDARTGIQTALSAFRAAPLSDEELARRAGQLLRFLALVPIEYGRGVRDGVITADIEVQEALTFHEGAAAAFADLRGALNALDATAAVQIDGLMAQALEQIRAVEDPPALQATIEQALALLNATIPSDWQQSGGASDIDVITSVLDQVRGAVAQGEYRLAESARLEAYALLELGLEQRLRGFAPDLAFQIESLFWSGTQEQTGLATLIAQNAPVEQVQSALTALSARLNEAQNVIGAGQSAPAAVITNAAIIVFREGLEAVVILASLLASLRSAQTRSLRRPIVAGGVLALAATALTWVIANSLLTLLLPFGERLEAVVSLISIGVLLLITNWFFHRVYWTDWMAHFHARKQQLVKGMISAQLTQALGLILLGFTSIYREGFETVLFLQSLVLDAGITVVLEGVAVGMVGVAIVGVLVFSLQVRLPYKKMLVVTGVLIGVVLLTMVGNTVHVMQALGWLPITPIAGVYLPFWMGQWFGVYATWQTVGFQFLAAAFVLGSYFLAEYQMRNKREDAAISHTAAA